MAREGGCATRGHGDSHSDIFIREKLPLRLSLLPSRSSSFNNNVRKFIMSIASRLLTSSDIRIIAVNIINLSFAILVIPDSSKFHSFLSTSVIYISISFILFIAIIACINF